MLGCERHLVRLVPHQASWADLFRQEAQRLRAALGDQVVRIEHVGSTSVPGVDAKPILDIVVAVRDMAEVAAFEQAVRPLGYIHQAENDMPGRLYFVKRLPDNRSTHHLNITELGTECWFTHVAFRDYLREHPEARDEYRTLKLDLVRRPPPPELAPLGTSAPGSPGCAAPPAVGRSPCARSRPRTGIALGRSRARPSPRAGRGSSGTPCRGVWWSSGSWRTRSGRTGGRPSVGPASGLTSAGSGSGLKMVAAGHAVPNSGPFPIHTFPISNPSLVRWLMRNTAASSETSRGSQPGQCRPASSVASLPTFRSPPISSPPDPLVYRNPARLCTERVRPRLRDSFRPTTCLGRSSISHPRDNMRRRAAIHGVMPPV